MSARARGWLRTLDGMGELLGMLAMGGLAGFIVWESFRSRRLSREELSKGFRPGWAATQTALLVLAGVMVYLGVEEWMRPSHPPFEGRYALLSAALYAVLGPRGVPLLSCLGAAVCIFIVIASGRKQ